MLKSFIFFLVLNLLSDCICHYTAQEEEFSRNSVRRKFTKTRIDEFLLSRTITIKLSFIPAVHFNGVMIDDRLSCFLSLSLLDASALPQAYPQAVASSNSSHCLGCQNSRPGKPEIGTTRYNLNYWTQRLLFPDLSLERP